MKRRKDGLYVEAITIGGKRRYFYGRTRQQVFDKIREYKKAARTGPSYALVADEWWSKAEPKLSPSTVRGYTAAFNRSKDFFRGQVDQIRAADVSRFIQTVTDQYDLGFKAAANHLLVVRNVLGYGVNAGFLDQNVARDVSVPRDLHREKRTAASKEDVEKLKQLEPSPMMTMAMLALYAGLRRGEIIALRWKDVDLDAGTISVERAVAYDGYWPTVKAPKTAASLATVPILDQLRDYLIQIRKKTGLVVPGPDGKLLNNQQQARMFKEWTEENGLGFTLHQLRHFFATALWEADVPADEAQILLRHSSLRMTMDVYRDLEIAKTKQQRIFERAKTISF